MSKVRIIEVEGSEQMIVDVIRAVTSTREVAQQSTIRAIDAESSRIERQGTEVPSVFTAAALPAAQQAIDRLPTTGRSLSRKRATKKSRSSSKPKSDAQSTLFEPRQASIRSVIEAQSFDDFERYNAAIGKRGIGVLDLAALVARLMQTQFNLHDGLAPSEILQVLRDRFSINIPRKTMEQTLRRSPRTFFSVAPAPFHHSAKLYRPMKDCIERVDELLREFDDTRLATVANDMQVLGAAN